MGKCAFKHCENSRHKSKIDASQRKVQWYQIPKVQTKFCQLTNDRSLRRQTLWIQAVTRPDITADNIQKGKQYFVCGAHFVGGKFRDNLRPLSLCLCCWCYDIRQPAMLYSEPWIWGYTRSLKFTLQFILSFRCFSVIQFFVSCSICRNDDCCPKHGHQCEFYNKWHLFTVGQVIVIWWHLRLIEQNFYD